MPITVNEGGTLYELTNVYANEGGTIYELETVHSNENGTFYEIHKASDTEIISIDSIVITYNGGGTGTFSIDSTKTIATAYSSASSNEASTSGTGGGMSFKTTNIPANSEVSVVITKSESSYGRADVSLIIKRASDDSVIDTISETKTVTVTELAYIQGSTSCTSQHGYSSSGLISFSVYNNNTGKNLTMTSKIGSV